GEVERLLPMLLGAANILHTKYPDIQFLIPAINDARKQQIEQGVEQLAPQLKAKIHILENTRITSYNVCYTKLLQDLRYQ
ncbi:hypothetical protein, partial [Staphylococcus epidermidis]|uniref:hypothetical protein n=1 Tax=Staphylococcus epidermidis TaxID=1282 RepID=UPI00026C0396